MTKPIGGLSSFCHAMPNAQARSNAEHHAQSINRSGITKHGYFAGLCNARLHRRGTLRRVERERAIIAYAESCAPSSGVTIRWAAA
jgi:hypothetical protein